MVPYTEAASPALSPNGSSAIAELLGSAEIKIQEINPTNTKNKMAGGGSPNSSVNKKSAADTTKKQVNKTRNVLRAPNLFEKYELLIAAMAIKKPIVPKITGNSLGR